MTYEGGDAAHHRGRGLHRLQHDQDLHQHVRGDSYTHFLPFQVRCDYEIMKTLV